MAANQPTRSNGPTAAPFAAAASAKLRNPLPPPFVTDYRPYAVAAATSRPVGLSPHADCRGNWDTYYRNNTLNGYKDRHYILREFRELCDALPTAEHLPALADGGEPAVSAARAEAKSAPAAEVRRTSGNDATASSSSSSSSTVGLIELGCGVGNTILPLLVDHPSLRGVACDISAVAVGLLRQQATTLGIAADRVAAGVVDLSLERVPASLLPSPVPFATLVFVLCSVPESRMPFAVETVARTLEPGRGLLFWRDYAAGDMAMTRFDAAGRRAGDDAADNESSTTFARSNGTLSHFFTEVEVEALFAPWFETVELKRVERTVVNRRSGTEMPRLWWQGRFKRREMPNASMNDN